MKIVAIVIWAIYATMIAAAINSAQAHDWYESACCSGQDCKPVPDGVVTEHVDGVHVQGYGVLSESDPRIRWSQDDRDHICAATNPPYYAQGIQQKLRCVYRKRKFM